MQKIIYPVIAAVVLGLSAFTFVKSIGWKIDEKTYEVKFSGPKANGFFKGLKADIQFDESAPEAAKISATIDATTVSTGFGMKNRHARSEEALDTDKYPTIAFTSTSVTKKGTGYEATGDLTLKGITKSIVLPFTFTNKANGQGIFRGGFTIAPKDFNLTRSGVPDEIKIDLTVPVNQ